MKPVLIDAIRYAWEGLNSSPLPADLAPIHYSSTVPKTAKANWTLKVRRRAGKRAQLG